MSLKFKRTVQTVRKPLFPHLAAAVHSLASDYNPGTAKHIKMTIHFLLMFSGTLTQEREKTYIEFIWFTDFKS